MKKKSKEQVNVNKLRQYNHGVHGEHGGRSKNSKVKKGLQEKLSSIAHLYCFAFFIFLSSLFFCTFSLGTDVETL
jgi:hypothetical protein